MHFIFVFIFSFAVLLPGGGCQNWQNGIVVTHMSLTDWVLSVKLIKYLFVTFNMQLFEWRYILTQGYKQQKWFWSYWSKMSEPCHFNLENNFSSDWKSKDLNRLKVFLRLSRWIQKFPKQGLDNWEIGMCESFNVVREYNTYNCSIYHC